MTQVRRKSDARQAFREMGGPGQFARHDRLLQLVPEALPPAEYLLPAVRAVLPATGLLSATGLLPAGLLPATVLQSVLHFRLSAHRTEPDLAAQL